MTRRPAHDAAVSSVVAVVSLVAVVVMLTVGMYVWVSSSYATGAAIPRFPPLVAKDAGASCTAGTTDPLFTVEHVGGDAISWSEFRVEILADDVDRRPVLDLGGASTGELPVGLDVGETLTATETTDLCGAGETRMWKVRVIAFESDHQIVYETEVPVR